MSIAFFDNLYFSVSIIFLLLIIIYIDILLFIKAAKKNKLTNYPKIYKFLVNILLSNLGLLIFFVLNLFSPINSNNEINKNLCRIQSIGIRIFIPSSDLNILIYLLLLYHEVFYPFNTDLINYYFYIFLPYILFICLQIPEFVIKNYKSDYIFNGVYCFENKSKIFHTKLSFSIFFIYFVKLFCFILIFIILFNVVKNIKKEKEKNGNDILQYKIYIKYLLYKLSFLFAYIITSIFVFIFKIIIINNKYNKEIDKLYYWVIIVLYAICGLIFSILFAWNSNLLSCQIAVTKIQTHSNSINSSITEISSELSSIF